MATTNTEEHGLVSIFESVECTLYNYIHEQGEPISMLGMVQICIKLADALKYCHMREYIHGAISSHCVYFTSSGIVKLGGWEMAIIKNVNINLFHSLYYTRRNDISNIYHLFPYE